MARFVIWLAVWIGLHFTVVPVTEKVLSFGWKLRATKIYKAILAVKKEVAEDPSKITKMYNMRRLFRSQIYCVFATVSGLYLLFTEYINWPMGLLHHWSSLNVPLFELALTNWLFACVEDISCEEEVSAHISLLPGESRPSLGNSFCTGLLSHHGITIFAYAWSLNTHYLGGLCVFGLCFEAPVLIMNIRDIMAAFEKEMEYPFRSVTVRVLKTYSYTIQFLFHTCRTIFSLLWPLSLIIWRKELATVPLMSRIVYHCLGALFCYVNAMLMVYFLTRYMLDDMVRSGLLSRVKFWEHMKVDQEHIDEVLAKEAIAAGTKTLDFKCNVSGFTHGVGGAASANDMQDCPFHAQQPTGENGGSVRSVQPDELEVGFGIESGSVRGKPSINTSKYSGNGPTCVGSPSTGTVSVVTTAPDGRPMFTTATVQQHNSARDAWIIFNDNVYDVTKFLEQHPGGEQVLLEVAGGDATDAFLDVGHSVRARRMMESYKIGSLADDAAETRAMPSGNDAAIEAFATFSARKEAWKGSKKPDRELLTTEGPYHFFKPYFKDMTLITHPVAVLSLFAVLLVSLSTATETSAATTASAATAMEAAKRGADTLFNFTINNNDFATLFAHVLCACGYTYALYFALVVCRLESFDKEALFQTVINGRLYVSAMLSAMWIAAEMSILVGFGLSGLGPRLYNTNMLLKMYQISLLLTYIIETAIRRLTGTFVATSSGMTRSQKETLLNRGIAFFAVALLVDLTGWYRVFMSKGNVTEMWGGAWGAVLIIQVAVLRCVAMRFIPDRTYGEEQAHYRMGVGAMISGGFTFGVAIIHYATEGIDILAMFRLLYITLCYALSLTYAPVYLSFAALLYTSHRLARWSNNAFTIQANSLMVMIAMLMTVPSFTHARWLFMSVLTAGLVCISMESWKTLTGTANPPKHLFLAKQLEDSWRSFLGLLLSRYVLRSLVEGISVILPAKYMLWMYPGPVSDIQHCDYGIAFQVNGAPQQEPKVFVCNVGHFGDDMYDYARTGSSTSRMMDDLAADPEAGKKGFVSDLVAVFPLEGKDEKGEYNENAYTFREVNFSSWASEEAAHDWYANNAHHKSIVKEYHNGGLNEFSAMLATLEPKKPIRFEVRCRECRLMSDGPGDGVCPHCGYKEVTPLPYM